MYMLKKRTFIGFSFCFVGLVACSENDLPEYTQLDRLRVLALTADQPEVTAGTQNITLTPLVSDVGGGGRTINYTAKACRDPGISYGSDPSCDGASDEVTLAQGSISNLSSTNGYTSFASSFQVDIPDATTMFSGKTEVEKTNGVAYLVTYDLATTSGETLKTFKRIVVSTRTSKNSNPSIQNLEFNGSELTSVPTGDVDFITRFVGDPKESYTLLLSDLSTSQQSEDVTVTWFRSAGEFKYFRTQDTESNHFTAPSLTTGEVLTLVVVANDDRGGVGAKIYTLTK